MFIAFLGRHRKGRGEWRAKQERQDKEGCCNRMSDSASVQVPWFLNACASPSWGFASNPANDWYDGLGPNQQQVTVPECPGVSDPNECHDDECNMPNFQNLPSPGPPMCYVEGTFGQVTANNTCPPGFWSCGQRQPVENRSYDIQASSVDARICAQPDITQCPVLGKNSANPVNANSISIIEGAECNGSFDQTISFKWPPQWDTTLVPQPVICGYDPVEVSNNPAAMLDLVNLTNNWENSVKTAGIEYPWPSANNQSMSNAQSVVDEMPATLQSTVDSILGPFCSQRASSYGLPNTACPPDTVSSAANMSDCLLFSVQTESEPIDVGSMCRSWCANSPSCDQYLVSGCSKAQASATPSDPIPAQDCRCISRMADPNYAWLYDNNQGIPADAKCWYFPCTGTPFQNYLITEQEHAINCPSFNYCQSIQEIIAGAGSVISGNWFSSYFKCSSNDNNAPGAPPSSSGGGDVPPPGFPGGTPSSTPAPPIFLGMNWWELTVVAVACLFGLFILGWVFHKRRAQANSVCKATSNQAPTTTSSSSSPSK